MIKYNTNVINQDIADKIIGDRPRLILKIIGDRPRLILRLLYHCGLSPIVLFSHLRDKLENAK